MKSMKNNKSRGNDGSIREFYKTFQDELKSPQMESINQAFYTKIVIISQSEAVIKNDRDKQNFKNWRPISLLNIDTKMK